MVDVLTETETDRPRDEVAAFAADPDNTSGFSRVAAPMMKTAMRRAKRKDLARLERLLE